jgi:hypothetical protein
VAISILFNAINVVTVQSHSIVTVGENEQGGWDNHFKSNIGSGSFNGFSIISANFATIIDPDFVDAPINDQDIKPSAQIQQV